MGGLLYTSLLLVIPAVILIHLVVSPYTKVEESFNIQAISDILESGLPLDNYAPYLSQHYDHFTFPGAVPRSFVAALALAGAASPFKALQPSGEHFQLIVRSILGLANAAALLVFSQAVYHAFGAVASCWYIILQASQFHVIYYASRTLPNSFAFVFSTLSLRFFTMSAFGPRAKRDRRARIALILTTFAGVVLRSELAILVAAQSAFLLFASPGSLQRVILPAGILAALVGLLVTVSVDSFFWQQFPLWPEWVAFRYNTIEGKSADWGVSPWHFYFTNSLPKLMMNPLSLLVCIPTALVIRATRRFSVNLLLPLLVYVCLYSILPHKEWRFIIYVIPGFTGVAASGASWIWIRRSKTLFYRALSLILVASVPLSALSSFGLLFVSSLNYPGGHGLQRLHEIADARGEAGAAVFLDNLSCQTGVTRFLQRNTEASAPWKYDKTEDPIRLADPAFWSNFDYVLAESSDKIPGQWNVVGYIRAYAGMSLSEGDSLWRLVVPLDSDPNSSLVNLLSLLDQAEAWATAHVTRGRWPRIRMEPRIHILAKTA